MSSYSDFKGDEGKKQAVIAAAKVELEKLRPLKIWLGFSLYRREGDTVMRVKGVLPGSPAVSAGLADDMALYKAKGVTIGSIADFAGQIKGSQVGDKIDLEVDQDGSNSHVTLIVGTQAASLPLVNNLVRIAIDSEVRESDYEIAELKPAVDEWVSKNAAVLEDARKKEDAQKKAAEEQRQKEEEQRQKEDEQRQKAEEQRKKAEEQKTKEEEDKKAEEERQKKEAEEKAKAAAASKPAAATSPTATGGKRGCKFGFRPHTDKWKKDICLMCGQTKAAHEEGYVPPEPSPKPVSQVAKKEDEEKTRREKEEQEAREREEAEKRQREEEERKKKDIEEQEAKVREELERIARDEAALKEQEAKFAEEERKKKRRRRKEEKRRRKSGRKFCCFTKACSNSSASGW